MKRLPELPEAEIGPFLRTIKAAPQDDAPRLVFADWLQERGDPRGEMIRCSCAIERTPHGTTEWNTLYDRLRPWAEGGEMHQAWVPASSCSRLRVDRIHRGLLHLDVDEEADAVRELDPSIFAAIDQGWVETATFRGPISRLLEDKWKQELRRAIADSGARWAISRDFPHAGWVPDWYEGEEPWTDDWVLEGARELPNLSSVHTNYGTFTDKALAHLRGHPGLQGVLLYGEFTPVGLSHLVTLSALEWVDVAWFRGVQPRDIDSLTGLKRLRRLNVGLENLSDEGYLQFKAMPWLEELACKTPNRVTLQAVRRPPSPAPEVPVVEPEAFRVVKVTQQPRLTSRGFSKRCVLR